GAGVEAGRGHLRRVRRERPALISSTCPCRLAREPPGGLAAARFIPRKTPAPPVAPATPRRGTYSARRNAPRALTFSCTVTALAMLHSLLLTPFVRWFDRHRE